jgi:hypothetical protein
MEVVQGAFRVTFFSQNQRQVHRESGFCNLVVGLVCQCLLYGAPEFLHLFDGTASGKIRTKHGLVSNSG